MSEERKLDAGLGVWTPWYVNESIDGMTDEEFHKIFSVDKAAARGLVKDEKPEKEIVHTGGWEKRANDYFEEVKSLRSEVVRLKAALTDAEERLEGGKKSADVIPMKPAPANTPEGEDEGKKPSSLFTAEEQSDLDDLHWTQFKAKYGMKPQDFEDKRKAEAESEQGGKDDSEA